MWTDGSRYRVELVGHPHLDYAYLTYLSKRAYALFGKQPYPLTIHSGSLRFRLQKKEAFDYLVSLGLPSGAGKAKVVTIPQPIIDRGWRYTKLTIRGIFDTDGTVFFSKKTYKEAIYPTIEITTISKGLAYQLADLLTSRGFRARLRAWKNPKYNVEYTIAVYGKKMLDLWFKEIGSSNDKHKDKVKKYKSLYKYKTSSK